MVSIQKIYQWTPSADNESSSSILEVSSGIFGFKFRRRWSELEQSVASSRSRDCRSRLGVQESTIGNSYNVTSPTPSMSSSIAMDALRGSTLCNLAAGCTGKRRVITVDKRRRKSRGSYRQDQEDVSRSRTKSLPLPKRQHIVPTKLSDVDPLCHPPRQPTPPAQVSQRIRRNEQLKPKQQNRSTSKTLQKPIIIHRRAASMESIQQVFEFYDDENTSEDEDDSGHLQRIRDSQSPTFQLIDIVEPSEIPPENIEYRNGSDSENQQRVYMSRNLSPSLPVMSKTNAGGNIESENSEAERRREIDVSRHELRSPELVRQVSESRARERMFYEEEDQDNGRKSSESYCENSAGLSARYECRLRTVSMSTVSVLSCNTTTTTRTVLSRAKSSKLPLKPEEVSGLPSDVLKPLHRSCISDDVINHVSYLQSFNLTY